MPPRKKRVRSIRSDDSENSTLDSKGPSSGSDVQMSESLRHQSKKVNSEDYDGDCELERNDKNRVKKTATRSRVLKQKTNNKVFINGPSSTPVTQMDVDDCFGFEHLTTPVLCSPVPRYSLSITPLDLGSPLNVQTEGVMPSPKPIFETPVEKPVKKTKRKRVARIRQSRSSPTKQEQAWVAHFCDVEQHEFLSTSSNDCDQDPNFLDEILKKFDTT